MISIGEALVDALLLGIKGHPRVRRAVEWVGEVGKPPEGVRLVADDGAEFTGVVIVDANKPRLMFAVRSGKGAAPRAGRSRERPPNGTVDGSWSDEPGTYK